MVWDTATGKQSWQSSAHKKGVTTVGFSPDCKTVVSAGRQDSIVRLWVSSTGKESSRITTDEDFLLRAFFSPDGQSLATVGYPFGAICLWKIAGGSLVRRIGSSHEVACFSADGKLLLAGGSVEDNSVTLWDVDTGKECPQSPEPKHGRVVRAVAFAPDGKRFAIGESFGLASVWDTNTGKQVLALEGHFGSVEAIAFSPDGKLLATGGYDGVVRLFNSATGQQLRPPDGHQAMVWTLALTPDGKTLVSGGHDRSIRFWEMPGGRPIRTLTWERGKEWHRTQADVLSLSVSDDGKRLASSDSDGPVRLWELASGKQIRIIDKCPLSSTVAWIRGGDTLLLGGGDGMIGVWSRGHWPTSEGFRSHEPGLGTRTLARRGYLRLHRLFAPFYE